MRGGEPSTAMWQDRRSLMRLCLDQNGIGGLYWDAGPWSSPGGDVISVEPWSNYTVNQLQMAVLVRHLSCYRVGVPRTG